MTPAIGLLPTRTLPRKNLPDDFGAAQSAVEVAVNAAQVAADFKNSRRFIGQAIPHIAAKMEQRAPYHLSAHLFLLQLEYLHIAQCQSLIRTLSDVYLKHQLVRTFGHRHLGSAPAPPVFIRK